MTEDAGYQAAIDNLAYYIREMSDETQVPTFQDNPFLLDEDPETQIEFCKQQMTTEQKEKWDELNQCMRVIMDTYGVSLKTLNEDTLMRIIQYDLEAGTLIPGT